jgi:hypothetical protein
MTDLAALIKERGTEFDRNAALPYPNLYFASVFAQGRNPAHVHICADFTGAAIRKVCNWMVEHHRFRPLRSNSDIKLRRLRLGDLLENPAAYESALRLARHLGESDIIAALETLPDWVSQRVGVPVPEPVDGSRLWARLTAEMEAFSRRRG